MTCAAPAAAPASSRRVEDDSRPDAVSQIGGLVFALLLLDPEDRIAEVNPAAEALLGRSASRLIGAPFADIATIGDPRVAQELASGTTALVARDIPLATAHATRRINLSSSPLSAHPGWRALTLSETGLDGDEREESLALRAPSILAHEIKNPLAAIRGASQLLARRLEAKDKPLADIIATEVDRIAGLIDRMQQLGTASRAAPGRCNVHEAIRSAVASVRAARGNGFAFIEEFDPSLPAVAADREALEQILINLVSNAADACAGVDVPRVQVRTRFVSGLVYNVIRLGKTVRLPVEIVVADNGPGIAAELHDHVFEPFVSGKSQGQGLGLALVRKLVRDMGGRIAHERDDKAGLTLFRINLAVAPAIDPGTEA